MPPGQRAVRVPEKLCVVMRVQVDEAGRDMQPVGVDHTDGIGRADVANGDDAAVSDCDVASVARHPRPVKDQAILDDDVVG